jgi:putative addiction module killer protein
MPEIVRYKTTVGLEPVSEWITSLTDKMAQARIRMRLKALNAGNFGDCKPVGNGVLELRIHIGAGYRVYCSRYGEAIILLLCGGDKRSQESDIRLAKAMWVEWKERQQ